MFGGNWPQIAYFVDTVIVKNRLKFEEIMCTLIRKIYILNPTQ